MLPNMAVFAEDDHIHHMSAYSPRMAIFVDHAMYSSFMGNYLYISVHVKSLEPPAACFGALCSARLSYIILVVQDLLNCEGRIDLLGLRFQWVNLNKIKELSILRWFEGQGWATAVFG